MSILLVSNYSADQQHSMLGFAVCLEREFAALGISTKRLSPVVRFSQCSRNPRLRKWLAYVDKYLLFPKVLQQASANVDLVHILDHGNAMYVPHIKHRPHLVTCHDMLAIRASLGEIDNWKLGPTGKKYQSLILSGLKQSQHIAAVSQATAEDVKRLTGISEDRMTTIYNGFYQELHPLSDEACKRALQKNDLPGDYFLHVGGDSPYKNRVGLIDIYRHILKQDSQAPDLVLAGRPPSPELADKLRSIPNGKVKSIVSPDRDTLTALYQSAAALIFPSTMEGFGLPIIEAQALGCPVFTTNRAPMTEVGGAAGRYFDPTTPEGAAKTVLEGLADAKGMRERGLKNVKRFSASQMAQKYVQLYKDICS